MALYINLYSRRNIEQCWVGVNEQYIEVVITSTLLNCELVLCAPKIILQTKKMIRKGPFSTYIFSHYIELHCIYLNMKTIGCGFVHKFVFLGEYRTMLGEHE